MTKQPSSHALAAKAIRAELKAMGIKGAKVRSDSFAGGNAVRVSLIDIAPEKVEVARKRLNMYQYGHFDGMTDSYEYSNGIEELPQVKYVQVSSNYSDVVKELAYQEIRRTYAGFEDAPETYVDRARDFRDKHGNYASQLVHRFLCEQKTYETIVD